MDKVLAQIRAFIVGLSLSQKLLLVGSIVVVAGVVALFVHLFGAAQFANLYTGLDPTDTQKIIQQLAAEDISYQVSSDGTSIDVPADRLDKVRVRPHGLRAVRQAQLVQQRFFRAGELS